MNEDIENVVTEQEAVNGALRRTGLRKTAVVGLAVIAAGLVGYLTHRFVVKPVVKKIRAKKLLKESMNTTNSESNTDDFSWNEEEMEKVEDIFPEEK